MKTAMLIFVSVAALALGACEPPKSAWKRYVCTFGGAERVLWGKDRGAKIELDTRDGYILVPASTCTDYVR